MDPSNRRRTINLIASHTRQQVVMQGLTSFSVGLAFRLAVAVMMAAGPTAMAAAAEEQSALLELDPARTLIAFKLDGSFHTTHGTFKLERGTVKAEPATGKAEGLILVDASSGESGNSACDKRMKESVLETGSYPNITFSPRRINGHREPDGDFQAKLTGVLLLHGTKHEIVLDTHGHLRGRRLTATCHFSIPYVEWGLKDPSVLFFKVAKEVEIDLTVEGNVTWIRSAGSAGAIGRALRPNPF